MSEQPKAGDIIESASGRLYRVQHVYPLYPLYPRWVLRCQRCKANGFDVDEGRGAVHWLQRWSRIVRAAS